MGNAMLCMGPVQRFRSRINNGVPVERRVVLQNFSMSGVSEMFTHKMIFGKRVGYPSEADYHCTP